MGKKPKVCVVGSGMKPPGQCPDGRTLAEKGLDSLACGPCRKALQKEGVG